MTIKQVLQLSSNKLKKVSEAPWLDAEVLLGYVLKIDRAKLLAHSDKELTKKQYQRFKQLVSRRLRHEPTAYITGHKEFYGLDFCVDRRVLIPRPETELLVETVVAELASASKRSRQAPPAGRAGRPLQINIADIGTGSGCIAIALAKTQYPMPHALRIYATDTSNNILKIAKKNARRHKVSSKITFVRGDLLNPLKNVKVGTITGNLPYLTTKQWLSTKLDIRKHEPREALDGGRNGLDYIKELLYQAWQRKEKELTIILEIGGKRQTNKIKKLAKEYWPARRSLDEGGPKCKIKIKKDLRGLDRVIVISIH